MQLLSDWRRSRQANTYMRQAVGAVSMLPTPRTASRAGVLELALTTWFGDEPQPEPERRKPARRGRHVR